MALESALRALMNHTVRILRVDPNTAEEDDRGNAVNLYVVTQTLAKSDTTVDPNGSGCRVEPVSLSQHSEDQGGAFAEVALGDFSVIAPPEASIRTKDRFVWDEPQPGGGTAERTFDVFAVFNEADADGSIHHFEAYGREVDIA